MRTILGLAIACLLSSASMDEAMADSDEQPPAKNTVFAEFFGAGMGIMGNYERRIMPWLSVRGGAGYSFSTGIGSGEFVNAVVSVSALYTLSGSHHLELSPGLGLLKEIGDDRTATATSLLGGYRYQPRDGGLFARLQLGPAVFDRSDRDAKSLVLFGVALGWSL